MAAMQKHLLTATGSFGLMTAYDMVRKAWRECQRCEKAQSSDDRRDAAINAAITLWHLTDWTWAGITATARHRPELAELFGVSGRPVRKDDLVGWAVRECPELELCQAICNGSKHVVCIGIDGARMSAPDPKERAEGKQLVARIEIVDRDKVLKVIDVLQKAFYFWYHHATSENRMA